MSLMRSALMFAGTSLAIAFVMEASIDANGAFDRVLDQCESSSQAWINILKKQMQAG